MNPTSSSKQVRFGPEQMIPNPDAITSQKRSAEEVTHPHAKKLHTATLRHKRHNAMTAAELQ